MNGRHKATRAFHMLVCLLMCLVGLEMPAPRPTSAQSITFGDPAFEDQWNYSDRAVRELIATRSWLWGPTSHAVRRELMAGSPAYGSTHAGYHHVQYFDKGRMEFAPNPDGRTGRVTNGRLVVEMMSGNVQIGLANQYFPIHSSTMPIAGGPGGHDDTPTYASLLGIATIEGIAAPATEMGAGNIIRATYTRAGVIDVLRSDPVAASLMPRKGIFYKHNSDSRTWHNIPDVFWAFLNQRGTATRNTIWRSGRYDPGDLPLFRNWVEAMGLPITEPYWTQVRIGSTTRWVLFQAFERRTLTYNPFNDPTWRVEMGNAGRDYYNWRPDPLRRVFPLEARVVQASTRGTARVCPAYTDNYNDPCPRPGLMDALAPTTALQAPSWAETYLDGWMLLQTDSAIYNMHASTKLVFTSIDNSVDRLIEPGGRVDHVHAPRRHVEVNTNVGKLATIGTRFSVVVTSTAQLGEEHLSIIVPSNGGSVMLEPSSNVGAQSPAPIIIQGGQTLVVIQGRAPLSTDIQPTSADEEQYWAELVQRLQNIPGFEEITKQSEIIGTVTPTPIKDPGGATATPSPTSTPIPPPNSQMWQLTMLYIPPRTASSAKTSSTSTPAEVRANHVGQPTVHTSAHKAA